jgi:hypothetical protein
MKFLLTISLVAAGLATAAMAADKPNFSGDWKLNAAKSTLGPMPRPLRSPGK